MNSAQIDLRFLQVTIAAHRQPSSMDLQRILAGGGDRDPFWVNDLHFFSANPLPTGGSEEVIICDVAEAKGPAEASWFTADHSDIELEVLIREQLLVQLQQLSDPQTPAFIRVSIDRNPRPSPLFDAYCRWLRSLDEPWPIPFTPRMRRQRARQRRLLRVPSRHRTHSIK